MRTSAARTRRILSTTLPGANTARGGLPAAAIGGGWGMRLGPRPVQIAPLLPDLTALLLNLRDFFANLQVCPLCTAGGSIRIWPSLCFRKRDLNESNEKLSSWS